LFTVPKTVHTLHHH